jgi:hypothetical protein
MKFLIKTYHDLKSRFWITRKYEKIIYLREWLRVAQVIIINQKMIKLSLEKVKRKKIT